MATSTFTFRLTAEGVQKLEADLKALGPAGEQAFQKLRESGPLVGAAFDKATAAAKRTREELEAGARSGGTRALSGAMGEISARAESLTGRLGVVGGALRALGPWGIAAGAGVAALGLGLFKVGEAADSLKPIEGQLRNVTGSTAGAAAAFASIFDQAQRVGAPLAETANTFARYARAAEELGASQTDIARFAETVQKLAVVGGAGVQEAAAGALQLAQGLASGRLQGDELRSVLENMPPVAKALAKDLGVSVGALRDLGAAGQLTANVVFPALLRASKEADRSFANMPETWERASTRFGNASTVLLAELDKRLGIQDKVARLMNTGAAAMEAAAKGLADTIESRVAALDARLKAAQADAAAPARGREYDPNSTNRRILNRAGGNVSGGETVAQIQARIAGEVDRAFAEAADQSLAGSIARYAQLKEAQAAAIAQAKDLTSSVDEQASAETKLIATGSALAAAYQRISEEAAKAGGATPEMTTALEGLRRAASLVTGQMSELVGKETQYIVQARLAADAAERLARVRPGSEIGVARAGIENQVAVKAEELRANPRLADNPAEQARQLGLYRAELVRTAEAQLAGKAAAEKYAREQEEAAKASQALADDLVGANQYLAEQKTTTDALVGSTLRETRELQAQAEVAGRLPVVWDEVSQAYRLNDRELRILIETQRLSQRISDPDQVRRLAEAHVDAARKIEESARLNDRFMRDAERNRDLWLEPFKNAIAGVQRSFGDLFKDIGKNGLSSFKDLAGKVKDVFIDLAAEIAALMVIRGSLNIVGQGSMGGGAPAAGGGGGFNLSSLLGGGGGGGGFNIPGLDFSGGSSPFAGLFGGAGTSPMMGNTLGGLGIDTGTSFGGAAMGTGAGAGGLSSVLGYGGAVLNVGMNLAQGNTGGAIGGAIGGIAGAYFGPVGSMIGSYIGSMIGSMIQGKKKIPKATAYYGPQDGDYAFLDYESKGKNAPLSATKAAGNFAADLINATLGSNFEINDPQVGFYLRGKGNGRAFGGYYDPTTGNTREYISSMSGDFDAVAKRTVLGTIDEALMRSALEGDPRLVEAVRRTRATQQESSDYDAQLSEIATNVEFARDFDAAIRSLTDGVADFSQAVGVQARQEVDAATKAVVEFKDKTELLGLPVEQAAAATKSFVEILFGIKDAAEPLSDTAKLWQALMAKFDNAGPLFEEVGLDVARLPELLALAQGRMRTAYNEGVAEQIRGLTDPFGLAMEKLVEQQQKRLEDATLIGADIVQVERLNLLERQAAVEQATGGALSGIRQFLQGLDQGALSPLSPAAKLNEAGFAFTQAANAARGGDLAALSQLTSLASPYLSAAQSYYGGNEQYAAIYDTVRAALSSTAGQYEAGGVVTAVQNGAQATVNQLVALQDENRALRVQVSNLLAETTGLRADLNRFLAQANGTYR